MFKSGRQCAVVVLVVVVLRNFCDCSGFGRCPKHDYMKNLNITRFIGHWYEVERSFYFMELISSCMDIDLEENARGQIEAVIRTRNRWSGSPTESQGIVSQSKKDPSAFTYKANSRLPTAISRYLPGSGLYYVLNTDYNNYAIIWSCTNLGLIHTDYVWIFGRHRDLNATLRAEIYNILSSNNIDSERLILPKNASCTQ